MIHLLLILPDFLSRFSDDVVDVLVVCDYEVATSLCPPNLRWLLSGVTLGVTLANSFCFASSSLD